MTRFSAQASRLPNRSSERREAGLFQQICVALGSDDPCKLKYWFCIPPHQASPDATHAFLAIDSRRHWSNLPDKIDSAMVLCGSEEKGDTAVLRTSKTPRQSSRLAEKVERHSKRKIDISDDEDLLFGKMKGRRKLSDPDASPKRRISMSPKNKDAKPAVGSPATSDVSDSGCKAETNHQSDKYCHFCQVLKLRCPWLSDY